MKHDGVIRLRAALRSLRDIPINVETARRAFELLAQAIAIYWVLTHYAFQPVIPVYQWY